jgi:hypothetical protein
MAPHPLMPRLLMPHPLMVPANNLQASFLKPPSGGFFYDFKELLDDLGGQAPYGAICSANTRLPPMRGSAPQRPLKPQVLCIQLDTTYTLLHPPVPTCVHKIQILITNMNVFYLYSNIFVFFTFNTLHFFVIV